MKLIKNTLITLFMFIALACTNESDTNPNEPDQITYDLSIAAASTTLNENEGSITITVSLDQTNQETSAIAFDLDISGDAAINTDFRINGQRSIASGQLSTVLTVTAIDNQDVEGNKDFTITLRENLTIVNVVGQGVTLTIEEDDQAAVSCNGSDDSYSISLNANDCNVDIQTSLGVTSVYNEQVNGTTRTITTNNIPNHNTGQFPNNGNPNTITEIQSTYNITTTPSQANSLTTLTTNNGQPRYRFGVLFNGILLAPIAAEFFTDTSTGQNNTDWNESALSSNIRLGTDCNNSHVFPNGMYHHHATPSSFIASLNVDGSATVQLGWAADGYPVYYKYGNKSGNVAELTSSYRLKTEDRGGDGVSAPSGCPDGTYTQDYEYIAGLGDLDECNGYNDPSLGYIYVITDTYPSIPRCFTGTPSNDFGN